MLVFIIFILLIGLLTNIEGPGYSHSGSDKLKASANSREMSEEKLQVPELSASPKQKRGSSKCNLRKSLAWDTAFFTNEGMDAFHLKV